MIAGGSADGAVRIRAERRVDPGHRASRSRVISSAARFRRRRRPRRTCASTGTRSAKPCACSASSPRNRTVFNSVLGISWFWFFGGVFTAQLPNYTKIFLGGTESVYDPRARAVLDRRRRRLAAVRDACPDTRSRSAWCRSARSASRCSASICISRGRNSRRCTASARSRSSSRPAAGASRWTSTLLGVFARLLHRAAVRAGAEPRRTQRAVARDRRQQHHQRAVHGRGGRVRHRPRRGSACRSRRSSCAPRCSTPLVAIYIYTLVPEFLMRFLSWILVNMLYRIERRRHSRTIPDEGAALLVCNHVSYMDALIVGGVRAAAGALRHVLQDLQYPGAALHLPHREGDSDRRAQGRSLRCSNARSTKSTARWPTANWSASFRKAALTRDGEIAPFRPGIEQILARATGAGDSARAARTVGIGVQSSRLGARTLASAAAVSGRISASRSARRCRRNTPTAATLEQRVRELRGAEA